MGRSQKKRLLAASERFRRNYFYYFGLQKTDADGITHIHMHIGMMQLRENEVWIIMHGAIHLMR